jgi:biopolymer transport protein ExbB
VKNRLLQALDKYAPPLQVEKLPGNAHTWISKVTKGKFYMESLNSVIEYGVIWLLILLSVIAVAFAIERNLVFRKIRLEDFQDKKSLELELTKKLHVIATIGSNAPYLGLLGTVFGIMLTFATMGREGFMDTGKIMVGLALALKATAAGLMVAIPAVTLYNLLLRKVKVLILRWEIMYERERI